MTLRGRLLAFFPLLHLGLTLAGPAQAIRTGNAWWLGWGLGFLYLFPPLCHRLHQILWPVAEGRARLDDSGYSPWWATLQFQAVFNAVPSVEALLRLVPGVYSAWLRLWGSRIGRGVVWTPRVEISDRGFIEVGGRVIFGHRVALYAHVVDRRKDGHLWLHLRRIRIGDRAFLGAGSRIGPGASIGADVRLPILTDVMIGERIEKT